MKSCAETVSIAITDYRFVNKRVAKAISMKKLIIPPVRVEYYGSVR